MKQLLTLVLLCCGYWLFAQEPGTSCGQKKAMENLFLRNPQLKAFQEQIESRLYEYNRTKGARTNNEQTPTAVVNLPVVVHIIHNNGVENLSDARVLTAIQHLNEAFANTGYYDPSDGVNTQIQFCLAKRDPNGNATSGINRIVSPLTVMNGWEDYSVDLAVKNLSRWDPRCYINIWLVKDITGGVAGYAYLPGAHGSNVDGIVQEAGYFGSSNASDIVVIHEMGHYLGLYHTFEGGCSNNDCARDGDRVCDTPPDQSTGSIGCTSAANSCTTDTQSGFSTDQNDLTKAYMDYGNWNCMKVFTQGQSDRMNWTIQNVRKSLLNCRSCMEPCPAPVVAGFSSSANNIGPGTLVNFTNTSTNAISYRWYVNNVLQSTATNFSYTFNNTGTYIVRLTALPTSDLCDSTFKTDTIRVTCPVRAAFTPLNTSSTTNVTVNFTNTSTAATAYNWFVNGVLQGTGVNFSYAFTAAGNYSIKLRATNGTCADSVAGSVVIIDTCITQTFQKIYGGAGDDVAYDVRSTTDGGYIMAGKTNSFGSGNYDGYIVKTDALGNVQWSKVYGGAAEDIINKIMQTPDGGYVFTGTTRSYGSTFSDAWVVKLDGSGVVQWAKRFGENTTSGEQGLNICLTSDGGYAVIGSHNAAPATSNVLVLKLDASGNLSWSKVFDSGNTDGGGYITQDGDVLMATGFTRTSLSYHDALVMKIDITNGNLLWMYRYEIGGRNNFGGEIYKIGTQYKFHVPSIQDFTFLNTARNIVLTIDNSGNATAVQELIPPDNGSGPIVMAPDGGIVAAYNEQNTTSEFNIMKLGTTGSMQWAKKYTRPGPQVNYILRHSQDGGYITVGASNPAVNNDIYFAKVDALGNSGGCDTASIPVNIATPSFSSGAFNWSINRNGSFNNQNITVQSSTPVTPSTVLCSGTTCIAPPPPPVDTCKGYNFTKLINTNGNDEAYDVVTAYDGGLMIVGKATITTNVTDAFIIKTDAKGTIQWSRRYGSVGNDAFAKIIRTADNNYVAIGYGSFSPPGENVYIVKIDPLGNVIWSKVYGSVASTVNGELGTDIAQTADGGYIVATQYNTTPATVQPVYMKLDASGNLLWSRMLGMNNAGEALGVIPIGDVVIVGGVVARLAGSTFNDAYLAKLRLSDGALLWTKKIESENRSNRLTHLRFKSGQLSMSMYNADSWTTGNITPMILKADTSGNITYSQSYNIAGINRNALYPSMQPTADGGFISGVSELSPNTSPRLAKITSSGTVSWVRNYAPYFAQMLYSTIQDSAGYVAVGSATKISGGNQDILVIKTTQSGLVNSSGAPCNVTTTTATNNSIPVTVTPADVNFWTDLQTNVMREIPILNQVLGAFTATVETPCIDTIPCYIPPPEDDDTCNASTYQKLLSLRGNESAYDVKRGIGGGLILAGKTDAVTNAGTADALLIKTDRKGNIEWSKTYASPGNDAFHFIEQTKDGNYIAVGTGKFSAQHQQDILIAKIAPNGNIIWSKAYGAGTQFGELGVTVAETDDGGFGISVDYNASSNTVQPMYMKVDASGNLLWSKLLAANTGEGIQVVAQGDVLIGAGISTRSGSTFSDGFLVKFRQSDGALLWTKRIESQNRSNRILGLSRRGNELHVNMFNADSWVDGNVTPLVFRTDTSGNVTYSRTYELAGINRQRLQVNSIPTRDGGAIGAISEWQNNVSPKLAKISPTGQVTWAKNYTTFSRLIVFRNLEDTIGYAAVGEAVKQGSNTTQHILLMKTNADGFLLGANCPATSSVSSDNAITVASTAVNGSTYFNISTGNLQSLTANLTVADVTMNVETLCVDSTQCQVQADTCDVTTYIRHYTSAEIASGFRKVIKTWDNNILGVGFVSANNPAVPVPVTLVKMKNDGSIIWQKQYTTPTSHSAFVLINTSDNNYLVLFQGGVSGGDGFYLLKVDASGNTIWKKDFLAPFPSSAGVNLIEGADNNFYVSGLVVLGSGTNEMFVTKISAAGALVWSKMYNRVISNYRVTPYDIADDGTAVVVAGRLSVGGIDNSFITRINKADGNILWSKRYGVAGAIVFFNQLHKFGGELVVNAMGDPGSNYLFRINSAGEVTKARKFTGLSPTDVGLVGVTQAISNSGEIVSLGAFQDVQSTFKLAVYKLDSSWTPLWARKYNPLILFYEKGVFLSNGSILAGGHTNIGTGRNPRPTILKLTSEGKLIGCAMDTFTLAVSTPDVTVQDIGFTLQNISYTNLAISTTTATANLSLGPVTCQGAIICNTLELVGPDTVCNSSDTVTFSTKRDSTCSGSVRWAVDTAFVKVVSQTDSTIRVIFKRSGSVKLLASMIMPCDTLSDSITVTIMQPKDSMSLGPDRLLCKISTITLRAGAGFKTYRWQDGSQDSTYTVTMPGTYSVEATDSCGKIFRDTVVIAQAPDVPFDLGPDLTKCDKDTLTITAPAGFTKYNWSDNYNISNRYTQSVQVWPAADTTYTVIAETINGCLVYDSMRVTIKTAPPLDLGSDTSICRNDSVTIIAPSGFDSYVWNTGETSQQIVIRNKGLYHISAQAPNGCIARDSLEILNVYALPVVNLGRDTIICMNGSYTFNAGNFASYLWHDGSTASTFTTPSVGKYWVQVTDGNRCVGSDTAEILRIAALPQNFLDTAAEFCSSEKITLTPKGTFSKYRWSTGSISRTIDVNIPAQYWLEVTNAAGCVNREYINVKHKNCRNSIDFPNAFTPNNDRRHETYKPVVRGNITGYKFTVFNRWGQPVFETTQINRAWDGTIAGKPQDTGTFVWICEYQFAGEEKKVAKGTLLLIR
jgi:gliding motility-associated-like protein